MNINMYPVLYNIHYISSHVFHKVELSSVFIHFHLVLKND